MNKEIYEIKHKIKQELETILNLQTPWINYDDNQIPIYTQDKTILVLSGGGIKGIAHIGALHRLFELGYLSNFNKFIGASVGGLLIALLVIGYTPKEIWDFIQIFEFTKMVSLDIFNISSKCGIDDGSKLEYVICNMISAKNIDPYITLGNLFIKTQKYIIFSAVSINEQSVYYISHITFPEMPLITAIRITTCIPIYFVPIKYTYNDKEMCFIDGGCMDNYPIHLCDNEIDQVLGLYIHKNKEENVDIENFGSYIMLVFETLMNGIDLNSVRGYEDNTINVYIDGVNSLDFGIDINGKKGLYNKGYNAIKQKLG